MITVPFQHEFRPALPNVYGTLDYREFRAILIKIDQLLTQTGLEDALVSDALSAYATERPEGEEKFLCE